MSNDIDEEQGISEQRSWVREAEEYLLRLKPESRDKWLDPMRGILGEWDIAERVFRNLPDSQRSFLALPRMWEMGSSFSGRRGTTERTFESVEGFVDCLKTSVG